MCAARASNLLSPPFVPVSRCVLSFPLVSHYMHTRIHTNTIHIPYTRAWHARICACATYLHCPHPGINEDESASALCDVTSTDRREFRESQSSSCYVYPWDLLNLIMLLSRDSRPREICRLDDTRWLFIRSRSAGNDIYIYFFLSTRKSLSNRRWLGYETSLGVASSNLNSCLGATRKIRNSGTPWFNYHVAASF